MATVKISGDTASLKPSEIVGERLNRKLTVTERAAVRINKSRATDGKGVTLEVAESDVIEIELEGGVKFWTTWRDFQADFGIPTVRGASSEYVTFPTELHLEGPSRGMVGDAIQALRILDVDLSGMAVAKVAEWHEKRTIAKPGLFRCESANSTELEAVTKPVSTDVPLLLFVHGTASSFAGSFSGLWGGPQRAVGETLFRAYGERVYAFEHHTLTQSPIENTLALLSQLPDKAKLHVVSHSRGGMIGELLCRAAIQGRALAFDTEEIALFADETTDDGITIDRSRDRKALAELNRVFKSKKPVVERFIRVACPVRGTTLASERFDRWLSVVINLLNFCGLSRNPFYEAATDLVAAVVKEHTDPKTLPGLEAMMPSSPLVKLLNGRDVTVEADLSVISGDIEGGGLWRRLKLLVLDRFYQDDHDLVVNTSSMTGGAKRTKGARSFFDQGEEVNHFHYFTNLRTAEKVRDGLLRAENLNAGFEPLVSGPVKPIARGVRTGQAAAGPRPIVFVLPGIMGSNLKVNDNRIWVDYWELALGRLKDLYIDARGVEPDDPIEDYYGNLIEYLDETHEVIPFAFDWRLSLRTEAARLARQLTAKLVEAEHAQQPVRLLAHSMGGLVVRVMIAEQPEVWRHMCQHPGGRFVMLGTPNGGSFSIPRALVGQDKLLKQLALLDVPDSAETQLKVISRFPGVLEMLPKADHSFDFFDVTNWKNFAGLEPDGWVQPEEARLRDAWGTREVLNRSPIDQQHMLYVAGHASATPCDLEVDAGAAPGDRLRFIATPRGDGRVPWDTGILPGVRVWYMDCEHGDMAAHEPAFPALLELLQTGQTTLLSQTAPAARGIERFVLPRDIVDVYPEEKDLLAAAVGTRRRRTRAKTTPRIKVRVAHGDLGFTANAVAVGHYQGDTIVSAENALDRMLDGRLREHVRLGLYPGPLGSTEVFLNPKKKPGGAIIIGLGQVGELTPGNLTTSFVRGTLMYAAACVEQAKQVNARQSVPPLALTLSTLLIGTGAGGIAIESSITAILRGVVRANRTLAASELRDTVRIVGVEFLELWEDRAIQAVRALPQITRDPLLNGEFDPEPQLKPTEGRLRRASFAEPGGWYHRLQITSQKDGGLRFNTLTDRARAEVQLQPTQRALVDQFIAQAVTSPTGGQHTARTLFELLIPNQLKEQAPNRENLVLVVDAGAARYPWELIQDRRNIDGEPLAVSAGVVRQLESSEFRPNPITAMQRKALVVGDPVSRFIELKGAQAEAEQVTGLLEKQGFSVTKRVRESAQEIVTALFADDYRILHLAGHGVYQYPLANDAEEEAKSQNTLSVSYTSHKKTVSGMVLGDNVFLTPVEVEQMRQVPELVFINCCHLGKIEDGEDTQRADRHLLAANLATQFIRMGVRAVVAAGWAVDDAAASTFSREFYAQLLTGTAFGEAVLRARKETYTNHGAVNTWGAYQCYGDPDWRLSTDGQPISTPSNRDQGFVAITESVLAIENLASEAKTADVKKEEELRKQLKQIEGTLRSPWLADAKVRMAFGHAYGELDLFEEAMSHYRHAIQAESGEGSFKAVEQLVNLQCRYAVERYRNDTKQRRNVQAMIEHAIALLGQLDQLSHAVEKETGSEKKVTLHRSVERFAILGSAYKRLAVVTARTQRRRALQQMATFYQHAYQQAERAGKIYSYPIHNYVVAQQLLQTLFPARSTKAADSRILLDKVDLALREQSDEERDFWDVVTAADHALTRHLVDGSLPQYAEVIVNEYLNAKQRAGSPREFRSVFEHLDFLLDMWRVDTSKEGTARLAALKEIRERLHAAVAD